MSFEAWIIFALILTPLSYTGFTALIGLIGRSTLGVVFSIWARRFMAVSFIIYGLLLEAAKPLQRA